MAVSAHSPFCLRSINEIISDISQITQNRSYGNESKIENLFRELVQIGKMDAAFDFCNCWRAHSHNLPAIRGIFSNVLQNEGYQKALSLTDRLKEIPDKNEAIRWIFWQSVKAQKWEDMLIAISDMPKSSPKGQINQNQLLAALSKQAAQACAKQSAMASALLISNKEEKEQAFNRLPKYLAKVDAWDEAIELADSSLDRECTLYWLVLDALRKQKREKALQAVQKISTRTIRERALYKIIVHDYQNGRWREAINGAQDLTSPKNQLKMLGEIYIKANKANAFKETDRIKWLFSTSGEMDWFKWVVVQEFAENKSWYNALREAAEISDKTLFQFDWLLELIIKNKDWNYAIHGTLQLLPSEKQDKAFQQIFEEAAKIQAWDQAIHAAEFLSNLKKRDKAFSLLSRKLIARSEPEKARDVIQKISQSKTRNEALAFLPNGYT